MISESKRCEDVQHLHEGLPAAGIEPISVSLPIRFLPERVETFHGQSEANQLPTAGHW